ncbi:hypothetical protein [Burkholderia lata]|uniref:hypothetical protein n=1 Tax=Burkholderia lata (strain ATCC 17760 / DSM 23089 / LMG 22485 / NCIMB 9086 / R18194 / 383) TaxID=482957 RepID=UPI001581A423|nr:hypothetical protein [Burkholderia lata]
MKIIDNGNFAPWFRIVLLATGIAVAAGSYFFLSGLNMFFGVVVGMIVIVTGTYAERSNLLHLKPFGNSYRKAHDSYKTKDGDEDTK